MADVPDIWKAMASWSDLEAMEVLLDELIVRGDIDTRAVELRVERNVEHVALMSPEKKRDHMRFAFECEVRRWCLARWNEIPMRRRLANKEPDTLELRVTGGFPDLHFVVHRTTGNGHFRVHFAGQEKWPRLLF